MELKSIIVNIIHNIIIISITCNTTNKLRLYDIYLIMLIWYHICHSVSLLFPSLPIIISDDSISIILYYPGYMFLLSLLSSIFYGSLIFQYIHCCPCLTFPSSYISTSGSVIFTCICYLFHCACFIVPLSPISTSSNFSDAYIPDPYLSSYIFNVKSSLSHISNSVIHCVLRLLWCHYCPKCPLPTSFSSIVFLYLWCHFLNCTPLFYWVFAIFAPVVLYLLWCCTVYPQLM